MNVVYFKGSTLKKNDQPQPSLSPKLQAQLRDHAQLSFMPVFSELHNAFEKAQDKLLRDLEKKQTRLEVLSHDLKQNLSPYQKQLQVIISFNAYVYFCLARLKETDLFIKAHKQHSINLNEVLFVQDQYYPS